jgi:hypothetical protein
MTQIPITIWPFSSRRSRDRRHRIPSWRTCRLTTSPQLSWRITLHSHIRALSLTHQMNYRRDRQLLQVHSPLKNSLEPSSKSVRQLSRHPALPSLCTWLRQTRLATIPFRTKSLIPIHLRKHMAPKVRLWLRLPEI